MIKLFTLENLSAFSSDAIYKICLSLDRYGLSDDKVFTFENYDLLFDAAETSLAAGDFVIVAAENSDYSNAKHTLASRFMTGESSAPAIAEAVSMNKDTISFDFDMEEQCTIPSGSKIHLSGDGLYSGISLEISNGMCTLVPLDFDRLDSILESYVKTCLEIAPKAKINKTEDPLDKFVEPVSKMVYALSGSDKTIAVATGEAVMNIYNLYNKVDGLTDVVSFVDVVDVKEEPQQTEEAEKEENSANDDFSNVSDDDYETLLADLSLEEKTAEAEEPLGFPEAENEEVPEQEQTEKKENASARTIRHAREAMSSMNTSFGAAISELQEEQSEDGSIKYLAYVAVADDKTTKTKVIATANKEETQLLLAHCVTILSRMVCQKLDTLQADKPEKKDGEKKFSNGMIAFAASVLLAAIIIPLVIVHALYGGGAETNQTTLPDIVTEAFNQIDLPVTENPTAADSTAPSTTNPFGLPGAYTTVTESGYTPAEPPATEVTVSQTAPQAASTSGTFTFYVFGYGHGVGLSQTGANYLASQGWNYAQILANYYYGTTLVSGDTYPETIRYNGQDYKTRDFLAGVLEAEMGSSFLPEALKAQCVSAYTFAKYYKFDLDTSKMAYEPTTSQNCYNAVDAVMNNGVYISYNGSTALTPFFATSAGKTTSYYNVWGQYELPYLQGGRPSYGDYNASNFKQVKTYSSADLKALIQSKDSSVSLGSDPSTWISVISHDACVNSNIGYISSINVGGKIMSGNDFRTKIMGGDLNSHCFMVSYTPDK